MLSLCAGDIMTRDVVTIHKAATVNEAMEKMSTCGVSGLPVVDTDGCLQGVITESDVLLKGQIELSAKKPSGNGLFSAKSEGIQEAYRRAGAAIVEDAMTRKVLAFQEESLAVDIARAMIEHAVNRVPIVRDCKVVGIVSRRDIVRALAREAKATESYDESELRTGKVFEL